MMKPLSTQLADLSARAKKAEDAVAAAQKEAHDKLLARREQAHADATAAIQKIDRDIKGASDTVVANWNTLKAKAAAELEAWNAKVTQFKHDQGVRRAETTPSAWTGRHPSRLISPWPRSNRQSRL
jgi:uncharacterized protein (DUF3084 family)